MSKVIMLEVLCSLLRFLRTDQIASAVLFVPPSVLTQVSAPEEDVVLDSWSEGLLKPGVVDDWW